MDLLKINSNPVDDTCLRTLPYAFLIITQNAVAMVSYNREWTVLEDSAHGSLDWREEMFNVLFAALAAVNREDTGAIFLKVELFKKLIFRVKKLA